jgi:serine/threonine protein kinase
MRVFLNRLQTHQYNDVNVTKEDKKKTVNESNFTVTKTSSRDSGSYSENENLVGHRYQVKKKLGEGSFGFVRAAIDVKTGKEVAIKFEHKKDIKKHLLTESQVYQDVQDTGFVRMYWFGKHGDYTVLVMTKLGPSLRDLYLKCNRIFTVSTVALIAIQVLSRLEKLHDGGWLHQDIKPENIVIGSENDRHTIYMIDYGTSSRYTDAKTGIHREKLPSGRIVGTARYSPITNHFGYYQSRKDDLQSFGYTLIYWMSGKLPWQKN